MALTKDQAFDRLLVAASKLNLLRVLSDGEIQRVTEAKEILTTVQESDKRKKYKLFLFDVLSGSGPGAVLLCAIALGQARITLLRNSERSNLCSLIQVNQSALNYPAICALSTAYHLPVSAYDISSSLSTTVGFEDVKPPVKRRRTSKPTNFINRTPSDKTQSKLIAISKTSSNVPDFATAQEQRVIENASPQGIAKVFDEYMCSAIRRVVVDSDPKAAITMVFPVWGGPVDCLMSLDICEKDVEQLAIALFNAEVKWAEHGLHVMLNEGPTLIIPNPEATLKGVSDVAIFKVFGSEIYDAITECPVHRRELAEGKRVTECVSVILTKNGAIINLSLGLERGLHIQNKIYS